MLGIDITHVPTAALLALGIYNFVRFTIDKVAEARGNKRLMLNVAIGVAKIVKDGKALHDKVEAGTVTKADAIKRAVVYLNNLVDDKEEDKTPEVVFTPTGK